jgi:predicted Zn-dependent peptidase
VLERSASPTFAALYQFGVGGATDPKGKSGIAHLLEHMMFKGTAALGTIDPKRERPLLARLDRLWAELQAETDRREDPFQPADEARIAELQAAIEALTSEHKKLVVKNEYDELMTRAGGVGLNASTSWDVTRYYIQLPVNRLEFWFQMESARLMRPVFREFYSERDVVHEERRLRTENTASGLAGEALQSLIFPAHPYGTPVVGWPRDIQGLERGDAMDYFTTYYSPSNCVMVLAGDLRVDEVERLARKYFGAWRRQTLPRLPITAEPEQRGERRRRVEFDANPSLRLAWRTVPEGHPDQYALDLLAMVLGGLASSRIEQTIVQSDRLAASAGAFHRSAKYGGYLAVSGTLRGDNSPAALETAFEREIERLRSTGVSVEELDRARIAVEASRTRGLKSNLGLALRIADSVFMAGSIDYIDDYERRLAAVTPEEVQRVLTQYIQPGRKNVVEVFRVASTGATGAARSGVDHARGGLGATRGQRHSTGYARAMRAIQKAPPITLRVPEIGRDVQRVVLPSGITVFIKEDRSAPTVDMSFAWLGGSNTTPVEELAAYELASRLLEEGGTEALTPEALDARRDALGMDFSIGIGATQSGAGFWSLSRNFDESFDLALEILQRPRFDAERLSTLAGQYIERMRRREETPSVGVGTLLSRVIWRDEPRLGYTPSRGEIQAITPDDVRAIWRRHLGRDNLYITVVGDFRTEAMLETLERRLGTWRPAEQRERRFITHEPILKPGLWLYERDLPQPAIRLYHQLGIDREAPLADHAALEILNDILGGSGFRSRLMERLRSDEGLTYGINSGISHQGRPGEPGRLQIAYQTRKDSVARSIDSVLEEVRRIVEHDVAPAEIAEQIEAWRNRAIFRYTNDFSIVSRLMYAELDDRPYDYDRQELAAVQQVRVEDVRRMAREHLRPERLTIAVFGTPSTEDRLALAERFDLNVLPRGEVFSGDYDVEKPADPASESGASRDQLEGGAGGHSSSN